METLSFRIEGICPLIVHNARLSDPLDYWTQQVAEISSKRKKTVADHEELARREFMGSLYLNEDKVPVIPSANLERLFRDAAAKSKEGRTVQAGMIVMDDAPILYKGPKDPDEMWANERFHCRASVKVGQQRVMRTRPWFQEWAIEFDVAIDETVVALNRVPEFLKLAGRVVGLGDWRPRHGRFEVVA